MGFIPIFSAILLNFPKFFTFGVKTIGNFSSDRHLYLNMLTKTRFFLLFFLISEVLPKAQLPCIPNPYGFRHLDRSSGLLSARVNAVTQDHLGFWWLGMESGLQRFNGESFQSFQHLPEDSTSLPNGAVLALHADKHRRIWVANVGGVSHYLPEKGAFKSHTIKGRQLSLGFPSCFLEDSRGDLWLASSTENGLFRLRSGSETWEQCTLPAQTAIMGRNISEDPKTGNIWVMYKLPGKETRLGYIDRKSGQLIPGPTALNALVRDACHFSVDAKRGLWTSRVSKSWYPEYLFRYDLSNGQIRRFDKNALPFSPLFLDYKDRVWFFAEDKKQFGFIEPGKDLPTVFCWPYSTNGRKALSEVIHNFYNDKEGNIWIATSDGVFIFNPFAPKFQPIYVNGQDNTDGKIEPALAVWESPGGKTWIGTFGNGTFVLDNRMQLQKKVFVSVPQGYNAPSNISDKNYNMVWAFSSDQDSNIWMGCQSGLLMQFSPAGQLLWKAQDPALDFQTVRSLAKDSDGFIWVGAQGGILARIDPKSREISRFETMNPFSKKIGRIYQVLPDKGGWLWLVYKDQILHYHTLTKSWDLVQFSKKDENEAVKGIEFISGAVAWGQDSMLVYGRGLYWLDKKHNTLEKVKQNKELSSQLTRSVIRSGNDLILIFDTGVARWSPQKSKVVNYSMQDGLPDNFSEVPNNGYRLSDGRIAIGMDYEGVYVFHPDSMRKADTRLPNVHIDGIWVKGQRIPVNPYSVAKNLLLRHSENFLTISYACPTLTQQHHLRFRYRLKGYSRDWVDNGNKRSVELTGLSPGRYTLEIEVQNREGLFSEQAAKLPIRILPPWYLSWPVLIVYGLLVALGIYVVYRFQLNRRLEMAETKRIRELDAFKTQFYTNITHEFRTPLTIILGMADEVEENPTAFLRDGIAMIRRNGQRLLELVNQVLELSKLESGHLQTRLQRGDGIRFLRYLTESYVSFANSHVVELTFTSAIDTLEMDFDEEKVQQILGNLLSNAIKFTPSGGRVGVQVEVFPWESAGLPGTLRKAYNSDGIIAIRVSDTGIGIAPEDQKRIFDRYYQVKNSGGDAGTGIGLTLALELARWMEGDITVESVIGKGTTFILYLPILRKPDTEEAKAWTFQSISAGYTLSEDVVEEAPQAATDKPAILLVEDSADVLEVLRACLQTEYMISTATNGRIGMEKAVQDLPDLIVSDVMMPEMDGKALCAALRQDIRTSHIPVILLTARAGLKNKLEGLDLGADEYLVKPFEKVELLARVRQLLEQRKRLQAYYLQRALPGSVNPSPELPVKANHADEAFMSKIRDIVESRYSDADFGIVELERVMGMGHTQFYLKFTALMGITALDYLRRVRLQKARELLKNSSLSISEIAYSVGFSDPAYFSKVFKTETGVSPNEWRK